MRYLLIPLILAGLPVLAGEDTDAKAQMSTITMIDATRLTMEELLAMANVERQNPNDWSCCDWGGGCFAADKPSS